MRRLIHEALGDKAHGRLRVGCLRCTTGRLRACTSRPAARGVEEASFYIGPGP